MTIDQLNLLGKQAALKVAGRKGLREITFNAGSHSPSGSGYYATGTIVLGNHALPPYALDANEIVRLLTLPEAQALSQLIIRLTAIVGLRTGR
jgi:hypothetical protein